MKYQSDNTSHVLSAIDDARQSFFTLEKSGVNNYFKNNKGEPHLYSTLGDIFDATAEALYEHKLSVNYQIGLEKTSDGVLNILSTTITHLPSGQYITSVSNLGNHTKSQELGSAITYLRRYHIQAMLNLEADFEDDGNLSSGNNTSAGKGNDINKSDDMPSRKYTVYNKDGSPHKSNTRSKLVELAEQYKDSEMWFGIEQEYVFMDPKTQDHMDGRRQDSQVRRVDITVVLVGMLLLFVVS